MPTSEGCADTQRGSRLPSGPSGCKDRWIHVKDARLLLPALPHGSLSRDIWGEAPGGVSGEPPKLLKCRRGPAYNYPCSPGRLNSRVLKAAGTKMCHRGSVRSPAPHPVPRPHRPSRARREQGAQARGGGAAPGPGLGSHRAPTEPGRLPPDMSTSPSSLYQGHSAGGRRR